MAFTKITAAIKNTFNTGNGAQPNAIFYPEDIEIVLDQPGSNAVRQVDAIVGGLDCAVMVGVTSFNPLVLLDAIDDLIALPCPPFNDPKGGIRKDL